MAAYRCLRRNLVIACGLAFAVGCADDDDGGAFEPVAIISATPSEGPAPLRVTFDGSASKTSSSSREYQWDLGDGTFDDRETFEHTYTVPGYYRVTLAVRDADRNAGTDSVDISVAADRLLSISGTATAVPNQLTDSDTNNPAAPDGPNDERAEAQEIPGTPAIIGGFLAATPTGRPADRFASSADLVDWYAIELEAGQTVQLAIADWVSADPSRIDFDLFVFDAASGSLFDASVGDGRLETVQVTDPGSYLIEVRAVGGFSNYTLSVGTTPSASSARELRTSAALVPGEILVRRAPASKALGVATEPLGLEVLAEGGSDVLLGRLPPATALKSGGSGVASRALVSWAEGLSDEQLEKLRTLYEVKRLRARADIDHAEPNYVLRPTLTPDDPRYPAQWHYPLIGLPQAWELSTGSSSAIVAVIDTGVFLAHSELQGKLIDGYDFIQDPARALDGDGIDPDPDDPGDGFVLELSSFHGTHVAGTVGAETNNELGVAGVSWGAQIMPVRVLGQGGGTSFDVLEGVRYAAGLENTSGTLPPRRADIINLSLGDGSPFSQFEQDVYTQVRNAGVIVISAAGNDGTSEIYYPASYDGVVSVSAVGPDKQRAPYSNFGMFVDVAAPGGNLELDLNADGLPDGVLSTGVGFDGGERTSSIQFREGTSMASPHMAGVAALMRSVYADLTPTELDALLQSGAITEDLGDQGRDDVYGYGLIDAVRALQEAARLAGGGALPSLLTVSPSLLVFDSGISELMLEVAQVGADPLTVEDISASDEWIVEVTQLDVDQAGLGTYRVVVDRTGLRDGAYQSTLTFLASNGESSAVTVSMRVGAESGPGDAGLVFVALLDASRLDEIREVVAGSGAGVYEYSFTELDAGIYFVVAGSDNDNDGDVCDEGEACGAYATLSLPDAIRLGSDDVANRDFLIGYRPDILAAQAAGAPSAIERIRLRP